MSALAARTHRPAIGFSRREWWSLGAALLLSLLLWGEPYGGFAMYPFKLLTTWLHEMSHALVALVTGAGVAWVRIYPDTSGVTQPIWSVSAPGMAAIAAAGYMGAPLWGALLFAATPTPRAARVALIALAVAMAITAVVVVAPTSNGDAFGPHATLAIAAGLIAVAVLPGTPRRFAAHFIAMQACVQALLDIRVLFQPMHVVGGMVSEKSDAYAMAAATFGQTPRWAIAFWAGTWLVWSLAVVWVTLRLVARQPTPTAA